MKNVGIIFKKEDRLIAGTAAKVAQGLKQLGFRVGLAKADFVITLGGDGTILRAARLVADRGIPILGVHMGGVGFLTEIELAELNEAVKLIRKNQYSLDERMMLEASVGNKKLIALNDLVIAKSGISRVIKFDLIGIANYTADGLIFSSPTGSTAYNLAAGGPLLTPEASSIIISAICPHGINNRSLIVNGPVNFRLRRGEEVILTGDGQQMLPIKLTDIIKVEKSKLTTRFIRLKERHFFERVKAKFGLGEP